jgi:hypothetical protein
MIEVLLYGRVREIVRHSIPQADAILVCDYIEGEHFQELLNRLGLKIADVGTCYINNVLAEPDSIVHDLDTIELNQRDSLKYEESN